MKQIQMKIMTAVVATLGVLSFPEKGLTYDYNDCSPYTYCAKNFGIGLEVDFLYWKPSLDNLYYSCKMENIIM